QRGIVRQAIERRPDEAPDRGRAHALDRRVHRRQALVERLAVVTEDPVAGMHHLQPVLAGTRRAIAAHPCAGCELRDLRGAEVEEAQNQGGARIVDDRHAQHRPVAETALHRDDLALDLPGDAGPQVADGRERGAVFVLPRQVQPQVQQRFQPARGQVFGHRQPARALPPVVQSALLGLPCAGSALAFALRARGRDAAAWLMCLTALACLALTLEMYPAVVDGGVLRTSIPWLLSLGLEFSLP